MKALKEFYCPITGLIMMDPVILTGDKETYEREAILQHLERSNVSPVSQKRLGNKIELIANIEVRSLIRSYLKQHPEAFTNADIYFPRTTLLTGFQTHLDEKNFNKMMEVFLLDPRFLIHRDVRGYTVFHHLCELPDEEILSKVIKQLSDRQKELILLIPPPNDWIPHGLNTLLIKKIKEGNSEQTLFCVGLGALINSSNKFTYDNTPLHVAVIHNQINIVDILIQRGADLEAKTLDGSTPLHLAVMYNHLQAAELLIAAGANLNEIRYDDNIPLKDTIIKYNSLIDHLLQKADTQTHITDVLNVITNEITFHLNPIIDSENNKITDTQVNNMIVLNKKLENRIKILKNMALSIEKQNDRFEQIINNFELIEKQQDKIKQLEEVIMNLEDKYEEKTMFRLIKQKKEMLENFNTTSQNGRIVTDYPHVSQQAPITCQAIIEKIQEELKIDFCQVYDLLERILVAMTGLLPHQIHVKLCEQDIQNFYLRILSKDKSFIKVFINYYNEHFQGVIKQCYGLCYGQYEVILDSRKFYEEITPFIKLLEEYSDNKMKNYSPQFFC